MTTSSRRLTAPGAAACRTQLDDYAFKMGLAHLEAVNAGQVHRLTTSQQVVGTLALGYTAGRVLLDVVALPLPRRKRPKRRSARRQ